MLAGGVDQPGVALLPVGDLLDHDPGRHVSWHTGPTGTDPFSFISHSPVQKVGHAVASTLCSSSGSGSRSNSCFWLQHAAVCVPHCLVVLCVAVGPKDLVLLIRK